MSIDYGKFKRFRPGRKDQTIRDKRAETTLEAKHFILPLFVSTNPDSIEAIQGFDGVYRFGVQRLVLAIEQAVKAGISKVLLFGVPDAKDKSPDGHASADPEGFVPQAIRVLRAAYPGLTVMTDVCLCAYTDHGHCGIVRDADVDNDATLPALAAMALAHARAGAQVVAPSAMADGQVAALRKTLDADGLLQVQVMGYAAKFASAFYGPFRSAAESAPGFGDRKSYQMDPRNGHEALDEIKADIGEGAEIVMVKPGLTYLDVIARAKDRWPIIPMAAYHTSGEFMLLKAAALAGVIDYKTGLFEQFYALRRAGADLIISYAAPDFLGVSVPSSIGGAR